MKNYPLLSPIEMLLALVVCLCELSSSVATNNMTNNSMTMSWRSSSIHSIPTKNVTMSTSTSTGEMTVTETTSSLSPLPTRSMHTSTGSAAISTSLELTSVTTSIQPSSSSQSTGSTSSIVTTPTIATSTIATTTTNAAPVEIIVAGALGAAGGVVLAIAIVAVLVMFCCSRKRKGKASAAVHSSNLVVLESAGRDPAEELEMGNKSSSEFSPAAGGKKSSVKKGSVKKGSVKKGGEEQDSSPPDKTNGTTTTANGDAPPSDPMETSSSAAPPGNTATPAVTTEKAGEEEEEGEAPVVKEYEAEVGVIEGQQAILRVEVTGVPQPTITWRLGDKAVEPDYAIEIAKDGALCFVSVEPGHAGVYGFTACNPSGSVEGKVELKVKEEGEEGATSSAAEERKTETKLVPVEEFGEHVAQLHANNNAGFYREYQGLPSGEEGHTVNIFKMPSNLLKNRFRNIAVYDDNRIALQALPSEVAEEAEDSDYVNAYMGDYINASYIDGYSKPKQYIACQGPLPNSVVDFWRAVWQEEVGSIVMVTNLKEGNHVKCHHYWPSSGSAQYGPFSVSLAEQLIFADYVIRHLHIALGGKSRKVLHLQFTSWPDHGVPEYAGPTLTYLHRVKAETKSAKGPAIFHCSAGVGRTGTLLSVDIALEQAAKEGAVDIQHIVIRLREQRMKMVQTHDQYGFIHDAVLESLICGETQIPAQNLPKAMEELASTDAKHGKSGYKVQFGVLDQVSPKPHEVLTITAKSYPDKNRLMDYLPSELWRVPLLLEHPGYINATFANGYKQHRGYIIAQAPMESTCRDFWKMVYDRRCGVIIMLSELVEQDKEVCCGYWPSKEEGRGEDVIHGEFTITAGNVKHGNIIQRTFTLVYNRLPHQQQKVTQYQVSGWTEEGLCRDPRAVLELIERVAATQRRTGNNPIVVHGVDTVSRCGLLCALSNAIDCCKTEGTVDVFQAVKALRIQKPGSVVNVQQYQSVFSIMQQFLNSFDIYSNFR